MENANGASSEFPSSLTFAEQSSFTDKTNPMSPDNPCQGEKMDASVGTVTLFGVPIVCLYVEGKERLCLAQISNTLLRDFSYNEIHNRRVALGITCLQCTPVQLEILRRTGAMPVSSRRCGLITKREAERLVKSFLEEVPPPKLPENFYFTVHHKCGWGCQGHFLPSRYNSSRAKCIKCTYCNSFFSPNKFIFHYHKTQHSSYKHPDAANFNSWRRHLHLLDPSPSESLQHAWEDVKAMFNGGCRKRVSTSTFKTRPDPELVTSNKMPCDGYDSSFSQVSAVINPLSRYLTPTPGLDTSCPPDTLSVHPSFPPPPPPTAGPYGNILRSLSMHYSPWWKSMYLPSQQFTNYNSTVGMPFSVPSYGSVFNQPPVDNFKNNNKNKIVAERRAYIGGHMPTFDFSDKDQGSCSAGRKADTSKTVGSMIPFSDPYSPENPRTMSEDDTSCSETIKLNTKPNEEEAPYVAALQNTVKDHSKPMYKEKNVCLPQPCTDKGDQDIPVTEYNSEIPLDAPTSGDVDITSLAIEELRELLTKTKTCRVKSEKKINEVKETLGKLNRQSKEERDIMTDD